MDNAIVDFVVENKFLLPIIILTRLFNFIEKMNLRNKIRYSRKPKNIFIKRSI